MNLTYEEIVKNAKQVADKIDVQPYEYYDCDCRIRSDAQVITDLIAGKLDATAAYLQGQLRIEGDFAKVRIFYDAIKTAENKKSPVIKKATVSPKTARNKPAAKVYV